LTMPAAIVAGDTALPDCGFRAMSPTVPE